MSEATLKWRRLLAYLFLVILCVLLYFAYANYFHFSGLARQYPTGSYSRSGALAIDPDNTLESLNRDTRSAFKSLPNVPDAYAFEKPVAWSQADFLKVANAAFQFVWNEPTSGWSMFRMYFRTTCQENTAGFVYADFTFFRESTTGGKKVYAARGISIDPQHGEIIWGGDGVFPHPIFGWKKIDLDQISISAEQAVNMAEEQGGKMTRLSVQNLCQIYVDYYPENDGYDGWKIVYGGNPSLAGGWILIPAK